MKRTLYSLSSIIVVVVLPVIIYVGDSYVPFDPVEWKAEDGKWYRSLLLKHFEPRKRMFRRLEKQYQLIGMSRRQLHQLLGPEQGILLTDEETYRIGTGLLEDTGVAFSFRKDKVVGYRFHTIDK